MSVALFSHPDCLLHEMVPGHPERPERLNVVLGALEAQGLMASLVSLSAEPVSDEAVLRAHDANYLEQLRSLAPVEGRVQLDPDTAMNAHSARAMRRAAGAVVQAVDGVLAGRFQRAFCAVRPPGHHAERGRAMGFCLLNNIAIGALHALARGVARVAIVDFDVHHGNGTQHILWNEPRAMLCSSFEHPLYPYSGTEATPHHIVNVALGPGSDGGTLRETWKRYFLPALLEHRPELLFVSAGFDAHIRDPLADLQWETADFAWLSEQLVTFAREHCAGRLVSSLEGGYDLRALEECTTAHVRALLAE